MSALEYLDSPERGVVLLDLDYRINSANHRAAELFGVKLDQLIGSPLPSWIKTRPKSLDDVIEEVLYPHFGPNTVLHRYSGPVYGLQNNLVGRVEIYSDITARRRLETEILERNRELAELNKRLQETQEELLRSERLRTLGEMAAGIAHDINNALGIVLGNVQLAKRRIPEDPECLRCIESIEMAAKDAADTVRKLKEIGRPVDRSRYRPIDLGALTESVIAAMTPQWQEQDKQIDITADLQPGCTVEGDEAELREALTNVMLNAVQAINRQGAIKVAVHKNSSQVVLTVADSGIGMSEETKKRVFDPFFTTRGSAGTGLGMSMVAAIVMRHNGKVKVESEQGKGTIVALCFPLAE
ncbi:MAG: ATP-binding protein [Armatimonadota bacterium]|nr:ATP-binding protein [Armatimonadota bacterium]